MFENESKKTGLLLEEIVDLHNQYLNDKNKFIYGKFDYKMYKMNKYF